MKYIFCLKCIIIKLINKIKKISRMIKVCLIVLLATFAFASDCDSLRKNFTENEKALFNSDD